MEKIKWKIRIIKTSFGRNTRNNRKRIFLTLKIKTIMNKTDFNNKVRKLLHNKSAKTIKSQWRIIQI